MYAILWARHPKHCNIPGNAVAENRTDIQVHPMNFREWLLQEAVPQRHRDQISGTLKT